MGKDIVIYCNFGSFGQVTRIANDYEGWLRNLKHKTKTLEHLNMWWVYINMPHCYTTATERKIVFWLHRYLRFGKLVFFFLTEIHLYMGISHVKIELHWKQSSHCRSCLNNFNFKIKFVAIKNEMDRDIRCITKRKASITWSRFYLQNLFKPVSNLGHRWQILLSIAHLPDRVEMLCDVIYRSMA